MKSPEAGEQPRPVRIFDRIVSFHEDFLARVPNYDPTIWSPKEALKLHSGGCMAELLYTAGGLLFEGEVAQTDLSIRFNKDHGKIREQGMLRTRRPEFKHVVLMINIGDNVYETDFRATRADQQPQFGLVPSDDELYDNEDLLFLSFEQALHDYAHAVGVVDADIPSMADIVGLHDPNVNPYRSASDEVSFHEDF